MKRTLHFGILLLVLTLLTQVPAHAQAAKGKRLILKDGSYQIATQWEVKGDRVRYFSAERFDWEELPNSLVDWPATEKYQKDRAAGNLAEQNSISIEEVAERKAEEARSPTIIPGLRLPESGGVFLLDNYQTRPQLVELVQNGSDINKQTSKNILRSVINPIPSGPRQTVELKGTTARIKSHTETPTIYVDVNFYPDDNTDNPKPTGGPDTSKTAKPTSPAPPPAQRFKIVRLQQKQDVRVVSNLKVALTGRIKEEQDLIDTTSEALSTDWMKITPAAPLAPGEYAVVEMLSPKQMNIFVWDFTVDPKAPANVAAWVPAPPARTETGTDQSPVLESRPRKK
ncbi:MAG: hypothetical protein JWO20_2269 [Candidatus Angelobacter sp.]|jgi:hypothetical protein|nr:hypothetical protein [Candidatus Angelobacter sp.]